MKKWMLTFVFLFVTFVAVGQTHFGVMTYNCENAFDTIHDVGRDDLEFLPNGAKEWTGWKYRTKMKNLARVVLATDSVQPVDVVCLCEVENDSVMAHLVNRTILRSLGYKYVMTNSDNERGTDVAVMYMPYTFKLKETQIIKCSGTRDVLRVSGQLITGDTLDVFAVHFPSRLGGAESERLRRKVAANVRACVDSIMEKRETPNVVVMGDFNATSDSRLLRGVLKAKDADSVVDNLNPNCLYQSRILSANGMGTYKYKGHWSVIDNILISGALLDSCNSIHTRSDKFRVVNNRFLLEYDKTGKSVKPKRSFLGDLFRGGFSDHLPVYVRFEYLKEKKSIR